MTDAATSEPTVTAEQVNDATAQLSAITSTLAQQRQLRESNLQPKRPSEADLRSLDSSLKRNTALIKKIKVLSEDSKKALLDDIAKVNQSKYVSEAVAAIAEAPLKASDIPAAVQVSWTRMCSTSAAQVWLVRPYSAATVTRVSNWKLHSHHYCHNLHCHAAVNIPGEVEALRLASQQAVAGIYVCCLMATTLVCSWP
jgi:hypothetical protein